ncbi:hypothetical protein L4D06_23250 [Enterovibrio makurazakiensis]|uniref:Uncharacterized protein n=1 Tax=Enterovibrio gelatinilyticus TaxID=2899819 RepID=A0ABT5QYW4_9GAMM|nr:hypothetical protein [Enterovibrio sp. ZSDZ42]MDD1792820.1 hypothetical protein [Enterovibrio sp. ZSDZ42]
MMWEVLTEAVDLLSKVAQTGIAGFGAWLAWKAFLKEDSQESEVVDENAPINPDVEDIKLFETSNQTTWLKKTINGIECHLDDRRPNKRSGHRWTLSREMARNILQNGDIYVNPGIKISSGQISIGTHTNWLYSKRLFPDPAGLHHRVVELLRAVAVE